MASIRYVGLVKRSEGPKKFFWEIGPLIISGSGRLPEQLRPSPKYPSLQTHSKDPAVFVQVPFT